MFSSIIGDSRAPGEGFFSTISSALQTGISKVGSDILPNWVQSQMMRQSGDQLNKNTFDQEAGDRRVDGQTLQDADAKQGLFQKTLFDLKTGNLNITGAQVLLMGAILIGLVIVLKKV